MGSMAVVPERRNATQPSHRTAANIGRERTFLNVFIQAPGLGRNFRRIGNNEKRRTGRATNSMLRVNLSQRKQDVGVVRTCILTGRKTPY